ncbi:hypothetical protein G4Y79_23115 [Phototrophicus methaneseepsis]|uniref:Uncharacterized protein n=1 Tax=Phototrophicus methaneseepsis TaxID=2710758 RepID=A0A7S8IEG2_9CHLR|nr:hypothetical protein [Phototrophicus methaneseepsis]QPC82542.1 hypothetical protein G4Y79_23115 [Phototrophicus methaneseepsis]
MYNKRYRLVWFFLALPLVLAAVVSQQVWGYVLGRPAPLTDDFALVDDVTLATLASTCYDGNLVVPEQTSALTTELADLYEQSPNDVPLFRSLASLDVPMPLTILYNQDVAQIVAHLLQAESPDLGPSMSPTGYYTALDNDAIARDWYYEGRVIVASGRTQDGDPLMHVSLTSGEVTNDDYHFYEYLLQPNWADGTYEILAVQHFKYEVAGMEGFEFPVIASLFLTLAFPLILASWFWARRGGEKRKRYLVQ